MKKILTLLLIFLSLTSYGKLMNKLGPTAKSIWDSIVEPTCINDGFYNGVTIMLVIGANAPGLDEFPTNGPYWSKSMRGSNHPQIYYLDDLKKMVKRGANLYFFVSPEVSKILILNTLPLADMIIYIGHGGFQNNIPSVFNMEIPIKQYIKENPEIKDVTSSNGYIPYSITPTDLENIKLKSNSLVLMFSVCYSSGQSATDPIEGVSIEESKFRTASYSNMFLSRGAKCYFAYNTLKSMFPLFESGLSIREIRTSLVGTKDYDKYFSNNHVIIYNHSKVKKRVGNSYQEVIRNSYSHCLVGDFNYTVNTLRGK